MNKKRKIDHFTKHLIENLNLENQIILFFYLALVTLFWFVINWVLLLGRALDAFVRALSFPFTDRRAKQVYYYEIGERRASPSAVTPRLAVTVSASLGFITLLSLIIATVWHPVYIILPPLFALYAIIILLRDQYLQTKVT